MKTAVAGEEGEAETVAGAGVTLTTATEPKAAAVK